MSIPQHYKKHVQCCLKGQGKGREGKGREGEGEGEGEGKRKGKGYGFTDASLRGLLFFAAFPGFLPSQTKHTAHKYKAA